MTEKEQLKEMVEGCVIKLSEHFDSVRIIATRHAVDGESNTSAMFDDGAGNFYAQMGSVREWLVIQEQYQRNWAIKKDSDETS
jgi:hypothetical protein